jgi:aerobic-type carbon monoxide dehydrogenase small subunit (CoxS/CutS family)
MDVTVEFNLNGVSRTVSTDQRRRLLDVLREEFDLTGTKYGCGEGQCGACVVLMDGKVARSCLLAITAAAGKSVTTIEGLALEGRLHSVQEAFLEEGAMQCGYCTSGMILSAVALLREKPKPSEEDIVAAMDGNICRCNGYVKILNAVRSAALKMRG